MKFCLYIFLVLFTSTVIACGKSVIPIDIKVVSYAVEEETVYDVKVKVPLLFKGYEYSNSNYSNHLNLVPMFSYIEEKNNTVEFYIEGTQSFFEDAIIRMFYRPPGGGLCIHTEEIDWKFIKESEGKNT